VRIVFEAMMLVASITERFVLRMAAAAKCDRGATTEAVCISFGIDERYISLNAVRAVPIDGNFS